MSPYLSVSCDSHIKNIFSGLSRLQQQQEFVDLTLAADGHLVKVHKNIIALASPYLKAMIQSVSTQNPVIFLNNVSQKVLAYLLEYIYQGEVSIPQDTIEAFLLVAQSLHITGLKGTKPKSHQSAENVSTETQERPLISDTIVAGSECTNNFAASITINSDHNFQVQQFPENIQVLDVDQSYYTEGHQENEIIPQTGIQQTPKARGTCSLPVIEHFDNGLENGQADEMDIGLTLVQEQPPNNTLGSIQTNQPNIETISNSEVNIEKPLLDMIQPIQLDKESADALKIITQYSVSERGSVQIIVSRYIYCSHHNSHKGRKHRWRCLDYRKLRCPAIIDSWDNRIVLRKGLHNHIFHDSKIYKKHKLGLLFHSIEKAQEFRESPYNNKNLIDDNDVENAIEFSTIPVIPQNQGVND